MPAQSPRFSKLVVELRRNVRLRLGLWLILCVLVLYASLFISDRQKAVEENYRRTATRLSQMELLARQAEWTGRADEAQARCTQLAAGLWKAEGRGMALAAVQNWIYGLLSSLSINDSRVSVEPATDVPAVESVWQVAVRVEGSFDAQKMASLLHEIDTTPRSTEIDALEVVGGPQGRFTLVIKTYFQAGAT